jgi:hypothetical protein
MGFLQGSHAALLARGQTVMMATATYATHRVINVQFSYDLMISFDVKYLSAGFFGLDTHDTFSQSMNGNRIGQQRCE